MAYAPFVLLFQLMLLYDVDGGRTSEDAHIPAPNITRDYPACTAGTKPKCLVMCSVPSVPHSNLSWYNGSVSISSLMISDFNTKLYLEVDDQDENIYRCVLSSPGINQTTHLDIHRLCQSCPDQSISMMSVSEGESVTLSANRTLHDGDDIMWFYRSALVAEYFENVATYHHCDDGRFGNRLHLDGHIVSLTISNISEIHSGHYKLRITNGAHKECQSYNVTVFERSQLSRIPLIIGVSVGLFVVVVVVVVVLVWFRCRRE